MTRLDGIIFNGKCNKPSNFKAFTSIYVPVQNQIPIHRKSMCICKGSLCLVCRRRLTSAKDIQVLIFMFQKLVKLSSVTPSELCNDTLRPMLKFLPTCAETLEGKYCLTCHPYRSLSSRMYPIRKQLQMSFGDGEGGGGHCCIKTSVSPHWWVSKWGFWVCTQKLTFKGVTVQYKIDPRMATAILKQSKSSPFD